MRILVACGGTGGHFYPGYALAKSLRSRGHEVLFLVRRGDPALARLAEEDLPAAEIDLHGLPRRPSLAWLTLPFKALWALRITFHVIRSYRPAVVAGMGSYVSLPAAWAARLFGVPYVIHEANAVLGLANRLSIGGAEALAIGLPLKKKPRIRTTLTGTPIRESLRGRGDRGAACKKLGLDNDLRTILVFGGSQGASALNAGLPEAVGLLAKKSPGKFQVLHLTGEKDETVVRNAYAKIDGLKAVVKAYLEGMQHAYACADVVVARSGAGTIAELAAQKLPALLIPYPHATAAHQEANARVLEAAGAAKILLEPELSPERLASGIESLLETDAAAAYARLDIPPAGRSAAALSDVVEEVGKGYLNRR